VLKAQTGRNDLAIELIRRALAARSDYAEAHNNLGRALTIEGTFDEARSHYERAVALNPDYADARINLGNILRESGRLAEAAGHYERALTLKPHFAEAWLGYGKTLQGLKRSDQAIAAYRSALSQGADPQVARFYLASLGAEPVPDAAPPHLVARAFDQDAKRYDQNVGALRYRPPDLLFDVIAPLVPPRKLDILDLGCGTGLLGARLHPLARTLAGVDLSANMLKVAQRRGIYHRLDRADLVEFLQAQCGSFDLAAAADVLVYIGDLTRVFGGARRALRDNGLFACSVQAGEQEDFVLRATLHYAHSEAYLRRLADEHGFIVETIESRVIRQQGGLDVTGQLAVLRCL
jgi:predicted TPR repeat methyltransferase